MEKKSNEQKIERKKNIQKSVWTNKVWMSEIFRPSEDLKHRVDFEIDETNVYNHR